jgi:membrane peptidoglycan carboxypeptidase
MAKVAGGELPAETWRKFMTAAHKDVPVHDFPNLPAPLPPAQPGPAESADQPADVPPPDETGQPAPDQPPPAPTEDRRSSFYDSLADDLGRAAQGRAPQ